MRKTAYGTVKVRAIAGTYVVFLAFDMKQADATGLMGFAIQRTRLSDGEVIWLRGNKRFPSVSPPPSGFEDANSHVHPFQAFQWADYTAEPGERYRYRVIPMSGPPGALVEGPATSVTIDTEPLVGAGHDVHWNRGAIASQAFVRRYPNMTLDQAGPPAYAWLTRDLLPGLLAFIGQASDASYSLRAAIYEFQWPEVLAAFGAAAAAGADVKIVYHADPDPDDETTKMNDQAIDAAGIRPLVKGRTRAKLMHDKFIVLLRNGAPVSVWTGSTNLSRNALFGQLNVGHAIHDPASRAPSPTGTRCRRPRRRRDEGPRRGHQPDAVRASDRPTDPDLLAASRPRRVRLVDRAGEPAEAVVHDVPVRHRQGLPACLRQERPDPAVRAARQVRQRRDGRDAGGGDRRHRAHPPPPEHRHGPRQSHLRGLDRRLAQGARLHRRLRRLDPPVHAHRSPAPPRSRCPSANWSEASVTDNDENMLVVRGDKRVADIYFGEFMRLFAHHRFRESVKRHLQDEGLLNASPAKIAEAAKEWRPRDLFEDWHDWVPDHFAAGSEHDIARRYFAHS
jgi:hypothetical protein